MNKKIYRLKQKTKAKHLKITFVFFFFNEYLLKQTNNNKRGEFLKSYIDLKNLKKIALIEFNEETKASFFLIKNIFFLTQA